MRIALETFETKRDSSAYYEFFYGPWSGKHWGSGSVYLHVCVFELVDAAIGVQGFNAYGVTTFSVGRASEIVTRLELLSQQVSKADRPEQVWGHRWREISRDLEIQSWPDAKRPINALLRDLTVWFRKAADDGQVVTIVGI
jgi:hypothetical protein